MPSTIGKCKLFRIKHITLLEGETFLRNKHEIAFLEIKCTFFGRKGVSPDRRSKTTHAIGQIQLDFYAKVKENTTNNRRGLVGSVLAY